MNGMVLFDFGPFLLLQSGQRFDTNSANEGSTNKLETNGFPGSQQQVNAQQMYTNNPGQLTNPKNSSRISHS